MPSLVTFISRVKECESQFNLWFHVPKMEDLKVHIQGIMLWEFKNNKNTTETAKKLQCHYWPPSQLVFKVLFWWYILKRWTGTRISSDLNQDALKELVECNPYKSTQELVLDFNTFQSTISCHLKKIGKVSKLDIWVPYTLTEKN